MRLLEIGIVLIILAVILPIAVLIASYPPSGGTNFAGVVIIFPIPIALTFGNEYLARVLTWVAYILFLVLLVLFLVSLVFRKRPT